MEAEKSAARYADIVRGDEDGGKGKSKGRNNDDGDLSTRLLRATKSLGLSNPHVRHILENGVGDDPESRKAVWNLASEMTDEELVELAGDSAKVLGEILPDLDRTSAKMARDSIIRTMLYNEGSWGGEEEAKAMAESAKKLLSKPAAKKKSPKGKSVAEWLRDSVIGFSKKAPPRVQKLLKDIFKVVPSWNRPGKKAEELSVADRYLEANRSRFPLTSAPNLEYRPQLSRDDS